MSSLRSRGKTTCYQCKARLGLGTSHFHGLYFCGVRCEALWWKEYRERQERYKANREREKGILDLFRAFRTHPP